MLKIYLGLALICATSIETVAQAKRKTTTTKTTVTSTSPVVIIQTPPPTVVQSGNITPKTEVVVSPANMANPDLIYQINGFIIQAKIIEVSPTEVIYKKWNNQDGPIFRISRNEVKKIKYSNGEEDNNIQTFSPQPNEAVVNSNASQTNNYTKPLFEGFNRKRFGVRGGVNSYKLNITSGTTSGKTSSATGFSVGFVGDFPIQKTLSLRASPMVSFKNTIAVDGTTISATLIDGTVDALYHIPSTQGDFVIGGGLALGYFLNADRNGKDYKIGNNPTTDDILPLDYGINITGGYDARTWSLSTFYTFGLANLNPSYGSGSNTTASTSSLGLLFTYWFGN